MSPSPLPKQRIFVSYSHQDVNWLNRLRPYLDGREGSSVKYFDDTQIPAGADWHASLMQELKAANVAILLVSQDFLDSKFIQDTELPSLLEAATLHGCRILPVIISPCPFQRTPGISRFKAVNPDKPLSRGDDEYRDQVFQELVREIEKPQSVDIFLSVPMNSLPESERVRFREVAEGMASAFKSCGHSVYCGALLASNPQRNSIPRKALRAWQILDQCSYFVMIYPVEAPSSVLVEAGYALKRRIPSVYIVKEGVTLPYMLDVSNKFERVDIRFYSELAEIEEMILDNSRDFFADSAEID